MAPTLLTSTLLGIGLLSMALAGSDLLGMALLGIGLLSMALAGSNLLSVAFLVTDELRAQPALPATNPITDLPP
jgi:hypothetical protein